jgi:hypothetical protein
MLWVPAAFPEPSGTVMVLRRQFVAVGGVPMFGSLIAGRRMRSGEPCHVLASSHLY